MYKPKIRVVTADERDINTGREFLVDFGKLSAENADFLFLGHFGVAQGQGDVCQAFNELRC
jgi:hypothetical protein